MSAICNVKITCTSRAFDVNFGELIFPDRINYPRPQKIDPFDGIHEVQSDRYESYLELGQFPIPGLGGIDQTILVST